MKLTSLSRTVGLSSTLLLSSAHAAIEIVSPSSEDWIPHNAVIQFQTETELQTPDNVRVFIKRTDVTSLTRYEGNGRYVVNANQMPLPSGETSLIVYEVLGGDWTELDSVPLKVLTRSGQKSSSMETSVDLTLETGRQESDSDGFIEKDNHNEFALNGSLAGERQSKQLRISGSANVFGSSDQEKALRFSDDGDEADKLDLADYLIEANHGNTQLSIGHVSYSQHPLLVESVSNRGISLRHKINDLFDVALSSQNGTSIVGFRNVFGLRSFDHNISTATVGYELIPSDPGRLRLETSYLTGSIETEDNFDVGEVPINEKSDGWGVRLLARNSSGRLSGEFNYARATYNNPADAELEQTTSVVKESTDSARSGEIRYQLIEHYPEDGSSPTTMTLSVQHSRTDPLYKTLVAFPNADTETNTISLENQFRDIILNLQHSVSEDNLDNINSILKTETRSSLLSAIIPSYVFQKESEEPNPFIPNSSLTFARVHQFAANTPDPFLSDFNDPSQLPDQVALESGLDLSWGISLGELSYRLISSDLDNRQVGRNNADFKQLAHELGLQLQPSERFEFGFSIGRSRNNNVEENLISYTDNLGVNVGFRLPRDWRINANTVFSFDSDSDDLMENDNVSGDLQVSKNLRFRLPNGMRRNGQFFVRYSRTKQDTIDRLFDFKSNNRNWALSTGMTVNLF